MDSVFFFPNEPMFEDGLNYPHNEPLTSEQHQRSLVAITEIIKQDFNQLRGEIFTSDITQAKTYDFKVEEARKILNGEPTEGNKIAQEATEVFETTPILHAQHIINTYEATKNLALGIDIIRLKILRQLPLAQTLGEMLAVRNEGLTQLQQFRTTEGLV